MNKKIFLIGFMGSGKSFWGRKWAAALDLDFYDLDEEVEKQTGLTVAEIFDRYGEPEFRRLERLELERFRGRQNFLLACGGGTPCFFDNMQQMKEGGTVIYLRASSEYILMRVTPEISQRPLLHNLSAANRRGYIENKLQERESVYLQAHHILDVEYLNENSLTDGIAK